jgi:hypothetical protein
MSGVGYTAALLLAAVFARAAAAKLARPRATASAFATLGLPGARLLAVVVPVGEAALVAALLLRPAAGGVGALAALAAFSAFLALRLARGATTGCGCFGGDASLRPLTAAALVRNALLAAAAGLALAAPRPVAPGLDALVAVSAAAVVGAVTLALLRLRDTVGPLWEIRG